MGWSFSERGFRVLLSTELPGLVRERLRADVDAFLQEQGLSRRDVAAWICHPGGPKVLEAVQDALGIPADAVGLTWESLATVGNLSSASVLCVLADTLDRRPPPRGSRGLVLSMGPGFCAELVLLEF
jgi:alkylresorcinol/alkylpyrone synthase